MLAMRLGLANCALCCLPFVWARAISEPEEEEYWRPRPGAVPPFDAPRIPKPTGKEFNDLILDGKVFVIPGLSDDWELRHWDCDFFRNDPEFKKAAMNHQYTGGAGRDTKLGDDWQEDQTSSGAKNDTAPQVAPFYFGIKDVQFEKRPGWTKAMLKRVAKSFKVPSFMHPGTERDFGATPEFWFGTGKAGAKAHMDSHVQATVSVQISGRKRWRLMPLRKRDAPFLAMIYSDGQPYENDEGWRPLFEITLEPGEGLFFPPGMVHETMNVGEVCASSVTFQFNHPYAARFYRRFFPRVRYTADIGESWVLIKDWARLDMPGDEKGKGEPFEKARKRVDLATYFAKLDGDGDGLLTEIELQFLGRNAVNAIAWHDTDGDNAISVDEFREGFAYWSSVTNSAIKATPKVWRKFQLFGTIENLEDIPNSLSKKMRQASLQEELRVRAAKQQRSDL